jgi:hypothetical protein
MITSPMLADELTHPFEREVSSYTRPATKSAAVLTNPPV